MQYCLAMCNWLLRRASCKFYIKRRTGIDVVMCRIWLAGKSVLITDKSHERRGVLNHWLFRLFQRLFLLTTQKMMKTYRSVRVSETKSGLSGTLFKAVGGRPYLPDYLSREWRCSWGRSSNYIWVINNVFIVDKVRLILEVWRYMYVTSHARDAADKHCLYRAYGSQEHALKHGKKHSQNLPTRFYVTVKFFCKTLVPQYICYSKPTLME